LIALLLGYFATPLKLASNEADALPHYVPTSILDQCQQQSTEELLSEDQKMRLGQQVSLRYFEGTSVVR
jgi:hypothetical protein